jgi:hypothetical protein
MKKFFLIIMILSASDSFAQLRIGAKCGINISNITNTNQFNWSSGILTQTSPLLRTQIGIITELPVIKNVYLQTGLRYSASVLN